MNDRPGNLAQLLAIWVSCVGLFPNLICASSTQPAVFNSAQVRQHLAHVSSSIQTWSIEYESVATDRPRLGLPSGIYIHRVIAAKAPDKYYHWSSKGSPTYNWQSDPLQQRLLINGAFGVNEYVWNRSFKKFPFVAKGPLPGTAPQELFFAVFGWWSLEMQPPVAVGDTPCVLRDIAASSKYEVGPYQEQIDGRWCHVLVFPGHDQLWIDCQSLCPIVAREMFNPQTGRCLQRVETYSHRQIAPGFWAPTEFRTILFDPAPADGKRHEIFDNTFKVLKIAVNDPIDNAMFSFQPGPGSIEIFPDHRFEQKTPGGTDYLDQVVAFMRPRIRSYSSGASDNLSLEAIVENALWAISLFTVVFVRYHKRARIKRNP